MDNRAINDKNDLEVINPLPVPGYEGFFYFPDNHNVGINRKGIIINVHTGKISSLYIDFKGYIRFTGTESFKVSKGYKLHRAMAMTFVGRPSRHLYVPHSKLEINHIDCDKANNDPENIEWVSNPENIRHNRTHGGHSNQYTTVAKNILTNEEKKFDTAIDAATFFNIPISSFSKLLNNFKKRTSQHKDHWVFKYEKDEWELKEIVDIRPMKLKVPAVTLLDVKNLSTGKCICNLSVIDCAKFLQLKSNTVYHIAYTKLRKKFTVNGFAIKRYNEDWIDPSTLQRKTFENKLKPVYVVKQHSTGKAYIFQTMAQVSEFTGLEVNSVTDKLTTGKVYSDSIYAVEYLINQQLKGLLMNT